MSEARVMEEGREGDASGEQTVPAEEAALWTPFYLLKTLAKAGRTDCEQESMLSSAQTQAQPQLSRLKPNRNMPKTGNCQVKGKDKTVCEVYTMKTLGVGKELRQVESKQRRVKTDWWWWGAQQKNKAKTDAPIGTDPCSRQGFKDSSCCSVGAVALLACVSAAGAAAA